MRIALAVCLLSSLSTLPALAAPKPSQAWELIDRRGDERILLDKARISRMPNGNTAAWSRLSLGFEIPDSHTGVRYTGIEAFNSYNCNKREYTTLKRAYVDNKGVVVREEIVDSPRSVQINDGSFEEKVLPHVCKPRAVGEMKGLAEQVVAVMAPPAAPAKATAQTADLRKQKAEAVTVADTSGKPRMIELPKIDPATVENPAPSPKLPPAKPEVKKPAKPGNDKAAEKAEDKSLEKLAEKLQEKPVQASERKKAASAPVSPNYHTGNVSRAEIERQLATFGPRKLRNSQAVKTAEVLGGTHSHLHWAYEGKTGPDNWQHISPDNKTCASGKRQSPIDIKEGIRVDLEPIKFNYGTTSYSVIDNGHTVQVNIAEGQTLRIMERTYQLLQFHFHKPA